MFFFFWIRNNIVLKSGEMSCTHVHNTLIRNYKYGKSYNKKERESMKFTIELKSVSPRIIGQ